MAPNSCVTISLHNTSKPKGKKDHYCAHVGNRETSITREIFDPGPSKLDDPIRRDRVPLELFKDVEDRVLATDSPGRLAGEANVDRLGHGEPRLTRQERYANIRGTHANRQTADGACRTGMRVGSNTKHAWLCSFPDEFGMENGVLFLLRQEHQRSVSGLRFGEGR